VIHSVSPLPSISGNSGGDPVSKKKLLEGEVVWDIYKEIIG